MPAYRSASARYENSAGEGIVLVECNNSGNGTTNNQADTMESEGRSEYGIAPNACKNFRACVDYIDKPGAELIVGVVIENVGLR